MMASTTIEAVTMISHTMLTVALLLDVCDYLSDGKALFDAVFEKALRITVELNVWIQCPIVSELSLRDDVNEFVGVLVVRAERAQNGYVEQSVQRNGVAIVFVFVIALGAFGLVCYCRWEFLLRD